MSRNSAIAPQRLRLVSIVVPAAVFMMLSACGDRGEEPTPEVRPVRTMTVATGTVDGATALTGTVQSPSEISESFRLDGRLIERPVSTGDTVSEGQLIGRLDSQNEESGLQSARAQLAAARARLVEANNNFERMRKLVAENAVSRAQFDQAEANRTAAASQLESAQSQVELAENRLSYTSLNASVAGTVTATGAEPGEVVGAGRMIVQVATEGARDAVFDVPARVKDTWMVATPEITIALVSNRDVTATGWVREVAPRADAVTGTFLVRVGLKDPPPEMRLGSTVTGRMELNAYDVIEIPAAAVFRVEQQPAVWVVDREASTVSVRNIEVRNASPATVIVESGLAPGEMIVTAGVQALRPGQTVRLLGDAQ